jgi:RimJ/RimL family protein N-acetyltransferase
MLSEMTATPTLTTERLRLDPLRVEDAAVMALVLADPVLYNFVGGSPPTVLTLEEQYTSWLAGPSRAGEAWLNWVIRDETGETVGHAQATVVDGGSTADMAWIVGASWQGRGYATEAARAIAGWLEGEGVADITAHVHPDHVASSRVAERAGLVRTTVVEGGEIVWRREVVTR